MLQSEALTVAKSLQNDQFKAYTGWLDSFRKRHNIVWNGVCVESKDVNESVVSEYKPNLLQLISPYEPKNIYNVEETRLFFRHCQQNQLWLREKSVQGAKCPKKDLQWEYGDWKRSKTKMFQESEN
jgi:hypothetical protein